VFGGTTVSKAPEPHPDRQKPPGLRVTRFRAGSDELAILSYPLFRLTLPESLTKAEREIAIEALAGRTNQQIAASRATSVRTVANQINSILRKTGASSRAELVTGIRVGPRDV
jgi:DNA-binding CsgD family transcriptional regulator